MNAIKYQDIHNTNAKIDIPIAVRLFKIILGF